MGAGKGGNPSPLLLEERFAAGDERFLAELARFHDPKYLAKFAEKWKADPRPWARGQALRYVGEPLRHAGHEPIVKRLFKHAEARGDHEMMGAFALAFDRLVRRVRKTRFHYDWRARTSWQEMVLVTPRNRLPQVRKGEERVAEFIGKLETERQKNPLRMFSYRTRYYLRRRAWRYFRRLGFQKPGEYVGAVIPILRQYTDADLAVGENILDSWTLLNACFRASPVLEFGATNVYVREGHSLAELKPAPKFANLWRAAEAFDPLLKLGTAAGSRLVRVWTLDLLRAEHAERLRELDPAHLINLLQHVNADIQQFAAEVFGSLRGLEKLGIEQWLKLLEIDHPPTLAAICEVMARIVAPGRLSVEQLVSLACAKPVPVARMAFAWLRERELTAAQRDAELPRLADAQCAAIGREIAEWALGRLGVDGVYKRDAVIGFFDSLLAEMRAGALAWLSPGTPGYDDPALWACLIETPFDDVRYRLLAELEERSRVPGATPDDLTPVWSGVLLGVQRGGRKKPAAVRQIAGILSAEPARFEALGPLLAVVVRSIRGPERRAGLAAVAGLLERQPELAAGITSLLPELRVLEGAGAVA